MLLTKLSTGDRWVGSHNSASHAEYDSAAATRSTAAVRSRARDTKKSIPVRTGTNLHHAAARWPLGDDAASANTISRPRAARTARPGCSRGASERLATPQDADQPRAPQRGTSSAKPAHGRR